VNLYSALRENTSNALMCRKADAVLTVRAWWNGFNQSAAMTVWRTSHLAMLDVSTYSNTTSVLLSLLLVEMRRYRVFWYLSTRSNTLSSTSVLQYDCVTQ